MGRGIKIGVMALFLAGVAALGLHFYYVSEVESLKKQAETTLDRLHMVRGGTTMSPSLIRDRVEKKMKKIGLTVQRDAISVRLEPVSPQNTKELSKVDQAALGMATKLKNHEIKMWFLQVSFPLKISSGWIHRSPTIKRTFSIKGDMLVDLEEDDEVEEKDLEDDSEGDDNES